MKKDLAIRDKAKQLEQRLIIKTRVDGSSYICIDGLAGKDYPEWMQDVCLAGHLNAMPNDKSYLAISRIISSIIGLDDDPINGDELLVALQDGGCLEPDCYTSDLTGWLHSNNNYVYYLDEAIQEYNPTDGFQLLALAQGIWLNDVAIAVVRALEEAEA